MTAEAKKLFPELNENQHKLLDQYIDRIIGSNMTMDAAKKSGSDAGAGYTIGYNAAKDEQRKRAGLS